MQKVLGVMRDVDRTPLEVSVPAAAFCEDPADLMAALDGAFAVTAREGSAEGVVIEEDNARVLHQLVKLGDDGKETEVIRARTSWRRKGAMTAEEKEMAAVIAAAWGPNKKGPGGKAKGRLGGIGPGSVDAALLAR